MKRRCVKKDDKDYKNYGGRGITYEWKTYEIFKGVMYKSYLAHSKIHGERQTTLERIDINGNYSTKNCRWATWSEQRQNCRNSRKFTYKGEVKTIAQLARENGISRQALRYRMNLGMSISEAINIPYNHGNKLKIYGAV